MSFGNFKVKTRLWLSFGLLTSFIVMMGVMTVTTFDEVARVSVKLYKHPLTVGRAIREIRAEFYKGRTLMLTLALSPNDSNTLEATVTGLHASQQQMAENMIIIRERFLGNMQEVENLANELVQLKEFREKTLELIKTGHTEEAIKRIIQGDQINQLMDKTEKTINYIVNFGNSIAADFSQEIQTTVKNTHKWVVSIVSISLVLAVWIIVSTTRAITNSLGRALTVANAVRDGNFDNRVGVTRRDEIGQLLSALDSMQTQLKERSDSDRQIAEEISTVTGLASQGDFSKRVSLESKVGTFKTIGESVNRVLEFNQLAIKDLTRVFSAVSQGNLTQTITNEYSGELARLKKDANMTVQRLTDVTEEISIVTHAASEGDFSKRIDLEDKTGTFKMIGESINQVLNFNQLAIKDLMHVFSAVAQGDLTKTITNDYVGELAQLQQDANATVQKLTEVIKIIRPSAEIVSNATEEISQGNTSLSQRTTQQAASLEETASSMEQMTATVQQNAENAKHANQLAVGARERAEHGNEVVNSTILAIKEISKSSKKINEIISVIDEIAFQTNLLALNAAVEAARAGESGRGFAVVASEVRSLAQRSASAAKEIKMLIQDSNVKVDEGSRLANQSGQTLAEIVVSVKKVSDIIAEIASASTEQSSGIEQVNKAISQMDEMVEQNSALVEQLAAASESMKDQAQELKKQVTFFKISHEVEDTSSPPLKQEVKPITSHSKKPPKKVEERGTWRDF